MAKTAILHLPLDLSTLDISLIAKDGLDNICKTSVEEIPSAIPDLRGRLLASALTAITLVLFLFIYIKNRKDTSIPIQVLQFRKSKILPVPVPTSIIKSPSINSPISLRKDV
uniref:Uncharacterized protein ORF-c16_031 n=1 Tax=Saccharolobus solfataricus TaxID=2287 RepID=Q9UX61_SACSO|nr:hypothetical protein [Saccharolobus solfataricus P2]